MLHYVIADGSLITDPIFSLSHTVSLPFYRCVPLQIGFAYLFTLVGFAQMSQWALGKHRNYIKNDPNGKAKGRKAIVPFLL